MQTLYVFNNDCEMAIANMIPHYMPPRNIAQLQMDLAPLLYYIIDNESTLLVPELPSSTYIQEQEELFLRSIDYITYKELSGNQYIGYIPWGIAPNLSYQLNKFSIPAIELDWKESLKERFSRKSTALLIRRYNEVSDNVFFKEPICVDAIDEINDQFTECRIVVKQQWSASGRGVLFTKTPLDDKSIQWIDGAIKRNGSVMIEPKYDKILDFALEYQFTKERKIVFLGYSTFKVSQQGQYEGNYVGDQSFILSHIVEFISMEEIEKCRQRVEQILQEYMSEWYVGMIGVDMMLIRNTETNKIEIYPFVEINYRMNMGIVALKLSENILNKGFKALFSIQHFKTENEIINYKKSCENKIVNGRLVKGSLPLVPITKKTRFVAELRVL